ncbi:hypothetical protein E1A91_D05G367600v1 [Gossypium mustelinum]|uniref:UVR domain-containing protein n=1 Tax=Gossypium mustelinum TaxID=34275 RepID=A0A5D2V5G7_GOSMU|nr:hypothetical protein E1A91_D05G367600v1 [Gossypium mustelinum]
MSREKLRRAALLPVQENIDKLEKAINEGNFYGAQQMYKSISARETEGNLKNLMREKR